MNNNLSTPMNLLLLIVGIAMIYTVNVEADFSYFDTKAFLGAAFSMILTYTIIYIGKRFSKEK